ncbi:hypothetical protein QFC19_002775 [Naganishia cerealis]|uniref:Uncharacterized protein n=1 Tax=Naganishia cerealis TaxID=610337 RepID=A0ACC2W9H6_9TREE|nr:hypothetical protein QFC19_002775 [Naganishia cerealis]
MPATSLLLFTTSQTPLPNRYPTPASTRSLPIPPLLHASLHLAVDRPSPSYTLTKEGVLMIPNPEDEIDAINGTRAAVAGEQEGRMQGPAVADEDAEVTVKFYLVSASPVTATSSSVRAKQQITRALRNLQHYKAHDPRWRGDRARRWIDTFLIGWKGVEYRGERRSSVGSAKKLSPDAERAEAAQREQALGSFLTDEQKREIAEIWTYLDTATGPTMAKSNGAVDCPVAVGAASGTRAGREQATEAEAEMVEMEQGPSTRHVTALNGHSSSSASAVTETDKSLLEALISPPPTSPSAATPQQPTRRLPAPTHAWPRAFGTTQRTGNAFAANTPPPPPPTLTTPAVANWLYISSGLVFFIIVVGGVTRLTESGLSITEWEPVKGILPPIGEEQWQVEWDKYKVTPEGVMMNSGLDRESFKKIFYMEWAHRLAGRVLGVGGAESSRLHRVRKRESTSGDDQLLHGRLERRETVPQAPSRGALRAAGYGSATERPGVVALFERTDRRDSLCPSSEASPLHHQFNTNHVPLTPRFVLPAAYFLARGKVAPGTRWKLAAIAGGIGFQGALGWYMVKSGLDQDLFAQPGAVPRVSQYRLAAHLGAALVLYTGMVHTAHTIKRDWAYATGGEGTKVAGVLGTDRLASVLQHPAVKRFGKWSTVVGGMVLLTAISGAFVAGLDAGLIYNEFPTMGGRLMPPAEEMMDPRYAKAVDKSDTWWRNLLENPTTVQFDHRALAITTFTAVLSLPLLATRPGLRRLLPPSTITWAKAASAAAILQVTMGITTLLYLVPIPLAAAHQAGSVVLLTAMLGLAGSMKRPSALARAYKAARAQQQTSANALKHVDSTLKARVNTP